MMSASFVLAIKKGHGTSLHRHTMTSILKRGISAQYLSDTSLKVPPSRRVSSSCIGCDCCATGARFFARVGYGDRGASYRLWLSPSLCRLRFQMKVLSPES